ncbi:hypothetical protein BLNAU_17267 [Blattamonas nauphoetae]|uniref:Uncharacterized protein n=1 Tax=Blattamonas nauphoetae TaxID=2049346 RepID=A0ABQ9XB25_9EUKA|nr:hypothetical protein BLNAU_17267 [Blattamonas nauphoetae]
MWKQFVRKQVVAEEGLGGIHPIIDERWENSPKGSQNTVARIVQDLIDDNSAVCLGFVAEMENKSNKESAVNAVLVMDQHIII